ncbi:MAG: sodium/solute symporter [Planctomycetota bacterium]
MLAAALTLHWLDYAAFFGYFAMLSAIGYLAGRRQGEGAVDYFLAGRSLPWYVVGSSYIAANISTEHFIGLIGAAVIYGICVATGEWSTVIAFTFLIWLFIPYLLGSKVYTAPEFLEKRFNKTMRLLFAGVTITVNIVAFMGPVIYGGALVLVELFDVAPLNAIVIIGVASGFWAIWGGLRSVALMDLLTIVVMVCGGLCVTYLGLKHLGDGDGVVAGATKMIEVNRGETSWATEWIGRHAPDILQGAQAGDDYNRLSVLQPIDHYSNPWTHWVFSFFYIGLWYTAINQHMIQKVLAAKDMYHARMGMVWASFLKLLLPFIVVVPGLIYFAMKPDFLLTGDFAKMSDEANKTYILMIKQLVPKFLVGVLLAALFGAIQSTVSSVLNSTSTVFTLDFYRMYLRPGASQREEVVVGRLSGVVILALSIGVATALATVAKVNLFIWIQMLYVFFAPPFSATFLLGSLWRRVCGRDAVVATVASLMFAAGLKILEFKQPIVDALGDPSALTWLTTFDTPAWMIPFAMQGLLVWAFCMVVCIVSAVITPPPPAEQRVEEYVFDFRSLSMANPMEPTLRSPKEGLPELVLVPSVKP